MLRLLVLAALSTVGPPGTMFYKPPHPLPRGAHGSLIWARPLTGKAVLTGARNELLLYRSRGVRGATAVSGTVAIPKGPPPRGGWPVIAWDHATVGLGDRCAPTRSDVLNGYERPLVQRWIRAGFAVVRTDYDGLGTPGVNPDLIGPPEARATLDAVLAAHAYAPQLNVRDVAVTGHSVGGHAVLWTAALAPKYAPRVHVKGAIAFAPSSHLAQQAAAIHSLTTPHGDLGAVAAVIVRGAEVADPGLHVAGLLSDRGKTLYPLADSGCLPQLAAGPFNGVAPADLFRPDADLGPLVAELRANDPDGLSFHIPVRIEQGASDTVVLPQLTDALVASYRARHLPVTYKRWPGIDHFGLVNAAADDATSYLRHVLR
jgi:dienelactone hydrolase